MMPPWWLLPESSALLAGGMLLLRPAGSVPAALARRLAVVWLRWDRSAGLAVQDLVLDLPAFVLLLGWAGVRLWRGA